jgi:hypothetical protein
MMGHAEVKMPFVYTVGMDENKRIAADRLGKELGGFENKLARIGQFLPVATDRVNEQQAGKTYAAEGVRRPEEITYHD